MHGKCFSVVLVAASLAAADARPPTRTRHAQTGSGLSVDYPSMMPGRSPVRLSRIGDGCMPSELRSALLRQLHIFGP
jgi:hypothetical protein